MLALSFLLLIGLSLILDGVGQHVPKGYIYFAMGFSVFVEMINLRVRKKAEPVALHRRYAGAESAGRRSSRVRAGSRRQGQVDASRALSALATARRSPQAAACRLQPA